MLMERQQRIVALADDLAATFHARADTHDRDGTFPHANYRDLHTRGYLRLAVPVAYGGDGASIYEMVLAQEHLARGDGATALGVGMTLHLMGRLYETQQWDERVYALVCRAILEQGALVNAAATEPEMGSPSRGGLPATTATPTDGGWLINGHKRLISMAPAVTLFSVSVRLPPSETMPDGGRGNAIIRADSPGVRIENVWNDALSLRASGNSDLWLAEVFVPDDMLIDRVAAGAVGGKSPAALAWFSLMLSAVYLGIGQAACNAVVRYARERTPVALGKPIAALPHVQRRTGTMATTLNAARAVLHQAAQQWETLPAQRDTLAPLIVQAKYLCTNAAVTATDEALRIAGGFGLSRDLPLERYFRDARAGITHPPHDDAALEMIGKALLES